MALEQTETMQKVRNVGVVFWTILGGIVLLYVLFVVLSRVGSVLTPFFLALVLVYILRPLVDLLERWGVRRFFALVLTYFAAVLIVAVILFFLVPLLVVQVQEFIGNFPLYFRAASNFFTPYVRVLQRTKVDSRMTTLIQSGLAKAQEAGLAIFSQVPAYTLGVVGLIFNFVLAPLIAFYILKDLDVIRENAMSLIPKRRRDDTAALLHEIDCVLAGFLRGQSLVALIVGVAAIIALSILRVPYALVIGLITGLLSVIPYFGPFVGALIAGIVGLVNSPLIGLLAFLIIILIQQLDDIFVVPYIMSRNVNVHPVAVIFALLLGGTLFGFAGLILAIPVAAVAKAIFLFMMERTNPEYSANELVCGPAEGEQ